MKNIVLKLLCVALLAGLVVSCVRYNDPSAPKRRWQVGDGNLYSQKMNVDDYQRVVLSGDLIFTYWPGKSNSLLIETDSNLISQIKPEVKDGVLIINTDSLKPTQLTIVTGSKFLSSLTAAGNCQIIVKDTMSLPQLDISLAGASNWNSQKPMVVDTLRVSTAGTSLVMLKGKVNNGLISAMGTGQFNLTKCDFSKLEIVSVGGSDIGLGKVEELSYNLSGACKLTYPKNTNVVDASILGACKITVK